MRMCVCVCVKVSSKLMCDELSRNKKKTKMALKERAKKLVNCKDSNMAASVKSAKIPFVFVLSFLIEISRMFRTDVHGKRCMLMKQQDEKNAIVSMATTQCCS